MGAAGGPIGRNAKEILQNSPSLQNNDGYISIRPDGPNSAPKKIWADMSTDGGGWVVVAEQNLITAPANGSAAYPSVTGDLPTTRKDSVNACRIQDWPPYTEFALLAIFETGSASSVDDTLHDRLWKYNTGAFGEVRVDMMSFHLDKSDYQGGRATDAMVTFGGTPWGDSNSHYAYEGYRWFNQYNFTYNHWGQTDLWGHIITTNIMRLASDSGTHWVYTSNCGAGWAQNSCRRGKSSYTARETTNQKAVFLVR
jgi:hypothetical protein